MTNTTNGGFTDEQVATFLAKRDLTVDLIRIVCVLAVVVLHSLMVGLSVNADGSVTQVNVLDAQPWFPVASWFGQIMPLFFIVGGFASWQGWESLQRKGGNGREFFRSRVLRLTYPALVFYVVMAGLLWAAVAAGVPISMLDALTAGIGMPLWFLSAYLICQMVVPILSQAHKAHPYVTVLVLLVSIILVDTIRYSTGVTEIGLFNLLLVWPLTQQIGFFYADGRVFRIPKLALPFIAAASFAAAGLLGKFTPYSDDMMTNLNPPTLPLVFIGVAHLALLLLAKPALDKVMRKRFIQGTVLFLGSRVMTIYLWHLLIVVLVSALVLVLPDIIPQPATEAWWWSRIPNILVVFAIVIALTFALVRFEKGPAKKHVGDTPNLFVTGLVAVFAVTPPFIAMQYQLDLYQLLWGSLVLALAVRLALGRKPVTAE